MYMFASELLADPPHQIDRTPAQGHHAAEEPQEEDDEDVRELEAELMSAA